VSVVWEDEYDPDELGDGFRIETNLSVEDVQDELWMDEADAWLAAQDVPDWTESD
jgi:hypothetical protein